MQWLESANNLLEIFETFIILFIFVTYWWDYRKVRLIKDWTGFYISYTVWVYSLSYEQYNPKIKRKYLWRPSSY